MLFFKYFVFLSFVILCLVFSGVLYELLYFCFRFPKGHATGMLRCYPTRKTGLLEMCEPRVCTVLHTPSQNLFGARQFKTYLN